MRQVSSPAGNILREPIGGEEEFLRRRCRHGRTLQSDRDGVKISMAKGSPLDLRAIHKPSIAPSCPSSATEIDGSDVWENA